MYQRYVDASNAKYFIYVAIISYILFKAVQTIES